MPATRERHECGVRTAAAGRVVVAQHVLLKRLLADNAMAASEQIPEICESCLGCDAIFCTAVWKQGEVHADAIVQQCETSTGSVRVCTTLQLNESIIKIVSLVPCIRFQFITFYSWARCNSRFNADTGQHPLSPN